MEHSKIERFLELKKMEAEITKEMNELKRQFRESFSLGDTEVDGVKISRALRTRIDLDKEKVLIRLGADGYKDCEKITEYEVLTVKRV